MLSETICVALITMSSGMIGAGLGAFVTLQLDSRASKMRLRDEKRLCYSKLISAYDLLRNEIAYCPEHTDGIPSKREGELYAEFEIAHTNALLICDPSVTEPLALFSNKVISCHLRQCPPDELHSAFVSALAAMRRDLMVNRKKRKLRRKFR